MPKLLVKVNNEKGYVYINIAKTESPVDLLTKLKEVATADNFPTAQALQQFFDNVLEEYHRRTVAPFPVIRELLSRLHIQQTALQKELELETHQEMSNRMMGYTKWKDPEKHIVQQFFEKRGYKMEISELFKEF